MSMPTAVCWPTIRDAAVVIVNRAGAAQDVTVDVAGYLPVGRNL